MWTTIRQYYLLPFLGFGALFTLRVLLTDSPNTVAENALIVVAFAGAISLFTGTIYYFMDTRWGPNKRRKMLAKSPFKEFLANGFEQREDFLTGLVRGYTVIISYTWQTGHPAITPTVLFHPKPGGRFHAAESLKAMEKRHTPSGLFAAAGYQWTPCSIGQAMEYSFKPPAYEKVMETIHKLIDILEREGLHPITYEENDKLIPELVQELELKNELP